MARLAAGVRKRADGTLEKRFTINGKRHSVYGKTAREIAEKEQNIREQIKAGTYTDNRSITLDQYFQEWTGRKRDTIKGNTLHSYTVTYNKHISPALGSRKIQSLERREILTFRQEMQKKRFTTPTLCNYTMVVLAIVLEDARRDEIIAKNPANNIPRLKEDKKRAAATIHRALTAEEQAAFMAALKDDYYYEFIALMLCTGMRCGEVCALQWDDIDTRNNVIHVRRTRTADEHGRRATGAPKSAAGVRDIPITDEIRQVLASQRQKLGRIIDFAGGLVFRSVTGGMVDAQAINHAIDVVLARLRRQGTPIERFTSHAFRDTFATRYIEGGGNMNTLKNILGHSSLAMTADLYSHVLPNTKHQEMNNIHIAI